MWKAEYAVGNLLLDGEHKQILDLLGSYIEEKLPPQEANWAFLRKILMDHVTLHFIHEETLMDLYAYPKEAKQKHLTEHKTLKDLCIVQLNKAPIQSEEQNKKTAKELQAIMEDHISTLDKELTTLFKRENCFKGLHMLMVY